MLRRMPAAEFSDNLASHPTRHARWRRVHKEPDVDVRQPTTGVSCASERAALHTLPASAFAYVCRASSTYTYELICTLCTQAGLDVNAPRGPR